MWRGWQLMGEPLKRELLTINQLQAKEHDSGCGSWATNTPDAPVKLSDLPFAVSSNVAPCDLMAWQLRASAKYFMQGKPWWFVICYLDLQLLQSQWSAWCCCSC